MKTILSFALLFYFSQLAAQAQKDINFVIVIDDKIVTGQMSQVKIIASKENGIKESMEVDYVPGNLSVKQVDYDKLVADDTKLIILLFNYAEFCNEQQNLLSYEIEIKKGWLDHSYFILRVYNTKKRKYRKILSPLPGKEYTYEFDYPGGSVKRVRNKDVKEDCN